MQERQKILVVGQVPPPHNGQAIMIEKMLNFRYPDISFFHVRMSFSSDMKEIGKFQFKKIFELISVILRIYWARIRHNIKVLYYPPAGPNTVPILRDIVILLSTRFLFEKTVFHFHAGGLSEKYVELNPIIRYAFRKAYGTPDLTIRLSDLNPNDGNFLHTRKDVVVPYGIDDFSGMFLPTNLGEVDQVNILFTGVLKESKGVTVLVEAITLIINKGYFNVNLWLMGRFDSDQYEHSLKALIEGSQLGKHIQFLGVKTGLEKFAYFQKADIFCFPTYYECETFGVVLLEAMQFGKPVVATNWRGIPDIITDNRNGLMVEPKDATLLSEALIKLISDKALRVRMGAEGSKIFKERFTSEVFKENFRNAIHSYLK